MKRYVAAVTALLATITAIAILGGGGGTVNCDQTLTTRTEVNNALTNASTGASGAVVLCVTADITGTAITTTTDMASEVRLVAQPMDGTLGMVSFTCNGCSNITIDGFEWTGGVGVTLSGTVSNFKYVRNYCHDQQRDCVEINGSGHDGVEILANRIENLTCPGTGATDCSDVHPNSGFGVFVDTPQTNFKFSYNECSSPSATRMNDCIEAGELDGAEIVGNNIHDMTNSGGPHGDAIMVWHPSSDILIKDNHIRNVLGILLSPSVDRLTMQNNLVAQTDIRCVDAAVNGTSGDIQPLDWNIDNNTIVDCFYEAWAQYGALAGRGSNIYTDNIFQRVSAGNNLDFGSSLGAACVTGTFETFTGNVVDSAVECGWNTGTNAFNQTTTFVNTTDYLPNNLPGGYTNAGYRLAPNGPSACGITEGCDPDPSEGAPAVVCDGANITTYAALQTALQSTGSSGQTKCITADITGSTISTSAAMTSEAEFVAQPADGTIQFPPLDFGGSASNITIYGAEWTGGSGYSVDIGSGANNIHIIKSYCHDQIGNCIKPGGTNTNILGNRIERIQFDGGFPHGNGIYGNQSFGSGAKLNYNWCDGGGPNMISDCMELVGMSNFEIIGNVLFNAIDTCCGAHPDTISLAGGSNNGVVKDNRIWNGFENIFSPTNVDVLYENNLITTHSQCVSGHGSGTPEEPNEPPLRATIRNNTLGGCTWSMCGAGGNPACTGSGRGDNVIEDNIMGLLCRAQDVSVDGGNVFDTASNSCMEGTNSFNWTESWINTSDPFNVNYYIPSSLPSGYSNAGYRYMPAGPDACGVAEGCKYG